MMFADHLVRAALVVKQLDRNTPTDRDQNFDILEHVGARRRSLVDVAGVCVSLIGS